MSLNKFGRSDILWLKAVLIIMAMTSLINGCIEPVTPEYDYEDGLVFIEGFANTIPGASFISINESVTEFGIRGLSFITGATVSVVNMDTGAMVDFEESEDTYLSPSDFMVAPGDRWKLSVTLPDGRTYESEPEVVLNPVPIKEVEINYIKELEYRESLDKFISGHKIAVSFDDPAGAENNYYWSYRTFENLDYCIRCQDAIFRNGACTPYDLSNLALRYFDYICETDCWKIRYPEEVNLFDDTFSNGKAVSKLEVGTLPLYSKENMVVEIQQFALTPAAYQYYKILKDITDNASGFNAPPPAALIGNLFNVNDPNEFVLGRFTAAASSLANVFVERANIEEAPLESLQPSTISTEPTLASPYPPPPTQLAPCEESRYRTAIEPVGWQ